MSAPSQFAMLSESVRSIFVTASTCQAVIRQLQAEAARSSLGVYKIKCPDALVEYYPPVPRPTELNPPIVFSLQREYAIHIFSLRHYVPDYEQQFEYHSHGRVVSCSLSRPPGVRGMWFVQIDPGDYPHGWILTADARHNERYGTIWFLVPCDNFEFAFARFPDFNPVVSVLAPAHPALIGSVRQHADGSNRHRVVHAQPKISLANLTELDRFMQINYP